jgi:integrase
MPTPTVDLAQRAAAPPPVVLSEGAMRYVVASKAPNTVAGYRSDWGQFTAWCAARHLEALPAAPATVADYLDDRAGVVAVSTLSRHLTSISQAHKAAGLPSPTYSEAVKAVWKGIRRTLGTAVSKKHALETADVRAIVAHLGATPRDVRDRALLLVGWCGALRRSELVALDVEDVAFVPEGLEVTIRRSKTDQEGEGATLGLPFASDPACCPVRALRAHLEGAEITTGAIFSGERDGRRLSGKAAAARVKRLAAKVGHDPDRIGGHSLRRGFITSAARAKVLERDIMRHSRHRSLTVFRGYIEEATIWDDNAAVAVGL